MEMIGYSIWLQERLGRGNPHALSLLRAWKHPRALYEADRAALAERGIGGKLLDALSDKSTDTAKRVARDLSHYGVWTLTPDDARYPASLCALPDLPVVLYGQGDFPEDWDTRLTLALVGTRHQSEEDAHQAAGITAGLVACGISVVTGAALGADSSVLNAAIAQNGHAVSVLACGVVSNYPRATADVRARLLQHGGAVISEYPPRDRGGELGCYPRRNRLLSGLTRGTVILSAPLQSGALLTARCAREQGRDVFAVPGSARTHGGCHALIRDGATLASGCADILQEYAPRFSRQQVEQAQEIEQERLYGGVPIVSAEPTAPSPVRKATSRPPCPTGLSKQAIAVFDALDEQERSLEEIAHRTGIPSSHLLGVMTELELTGTIRTSAGGQYRLKG